MTGPLEEPGLVPSTLWPSWALMHVVYGPVWRQKDSHTYYKSRGKRLLKVLV